MDRTVVIYLRTNNLITDEIGQQVEADIIETEVYAQQKSVSRNEWFEAGRNGLNPNTVFVMNALEYSGEKVVRCDDILFSVYRTHHAENDSMELYCELKGGVVNGD